VVRNEESIIFAKNISDTLLSYLCSQVFGQEEVCRKLLIAFLSGGHVLVEGVPGIAKTLLVTTMAQLMGLKVKRIQFTPDLLPSDLIGITFFRPDIQQFISEKGPIFTNILIADEINRAPPKVQSALLEAMAERQVTLLKETFLLDKPFFVMATQNPIEQEGTYPLPEAELDRFMMKLDMTYTKEEDEVRVVRYRIVHDTPLPVASLVTPEELDRLRKMVDDIYVKDAVIDYAVRLTRNTRPGLFLQPEEILYGASPRAAMWLIRAAKAFALMEAREYITPSDIQKFALDIFRHRVIPTYTSLAAGKTSEFFIKKVLQVTPSP
jgi:MoxR-like ATPase